MRLKLNDIKFSSICGGSKNLSPAAQDQSGSISPIFDCMSGLIKMPTKDNLLKLHQLIELTDNAPVSKIDLQNFISLRDAYIANKNDQTAKNLYEKDQLRLISKLAR